MIITKDKDLLENLIKIARENEYHCEGLLWENKKILEIINSLSYIGILVVEIDQLNLEIKKFIKRIKENFKNCRILLLLKDIDPLIENFIMEFSIDAYLTFPISSSQFLRTLYILKNQF